MKRIYLDPGDCLTDKHAVNIKGNTFRYLSKVLRMKEGDIFSGFDGAGFEHTVKILTAGGEHIKASLLESKKVSGAELPFNMLLFQSIPKKGKMDSIIRDVAQLGIKKIIPVLSERVICSLTSCREKGKMKRWEKIAAESSRIAGRQMVTEIGDFIRFEDAVKIKTDASVIFWEQATASLREIVKNLPEVKSGSSVKIFVGPEGGYTENEVSLAKACGAMPASMGRRILRVETASVIAAALIIYELENRM
ncbi:MAG: 16S rRNA (uracil(1498)-N(3))-methyltransferase [Candidatus Omnitrophica bacterium]|nr:16S rRNA (uracil(1498)-N(3))-methyltransferase [Candidatus Omnitrophota bacterium]